MLRLNCAFVLFIFSTALSQSQSSFLSMAQADAIKADETRWNTDELGAYSYGSITFDVVSVGPARKNGTNYNPQSGTVEAEVIEHLTGGKSQYPGYQRTVYWLTPQGDSWTTGGFPHARAQIYSSAALARNPPAYVAPPSKFALAVASAAGKMIGFALLLLILFPLFLYVRWATKPKVVGRVGCINPSCRKIVEPPQGTPCENCTSRNTKVIKMAVGGDYDSVSQRYSKGYYGIVKYCFNCKTQDGFDTRCPHCGTDLKRIMIDRAS